MSAKKIIFAGPSLDAINDTNLDDTLILPPCRQGDVYLATLEEPSVIGIIDGFFEGMPSVWHKEILWAMSKGIVVAGAASMGALRACELDRYGMVGIGKIYEAYRDKEIEDDDEVALLHGPAEMDFVPLSLAMVNVRSTVLSAKAENILDADTAMQIITIAKNIFYKERDWQTISTTAQKDGVSASQLGEFVDWLKDHEVDQKMLDAQTLMEFIQTNEYTKCTKVEFEFEVTEFWYQTTNRWKDQTRIERSQNKDDHSSDGYRLFN